MTSLPDPRLQVSTVDLASYASALRRHWRKAGVLGLVGLMLGGLVTFAIPQTYTATAKVFAPGVPGHLAFDLGQARTRSRQPREWTQDTEAELLRSTVVLRRAAQRLGGSWTALDLAPRIHLAVPTSTRVFWVSFTAEDAETARRGAQIVAEEFVRERSALLTHRTQRITAVLRERRSRLQTMLTPGDGDTGVVNPILRARLRDQVARIDQALQTVAGTSANAAHVVENPAPPRHAVRVNAEVPPLSGLMAGLLTGVAVGWLRDRRHPYVRDADEVAHVTNLPVLAHVDDHFLQARTLPAGVVAPWGVASLAALLARVVPGSNVRVLVTGWCKDDVLALVADRLRQALAAASAEGAESEGAGNEGTENGAIGGPAVVSCRAGSATALRRAREADVVLLVAELARGVRRDLARTARLLTRTGARVGVVTLATTRIASAASSSPQPTSSPPPATPPQPRPADHTMTGTPR